MHTFITLSVHPTYHFDTQCASSMATATTHPLSGGLSNSSLHFSEPIMASGEPNNRLNFPASMPQSEANNDLSTPLCPLIKQH